MTQTTTEVASVIHQIVQAELGRDIELSPRFLDLEFQRDLGMDSLMMVILQVAIEDAFAVHFDPIGEDLATVFHSVGTLVAYIEQHHAR